MTGKGKAPTFLWINKKSHPIEGGIKLLEKKYSGPNFQLVFRELEDVTAEAVDILVQMIEADYVILDGRVPVLTIALLLTGEAFVPRYEGRVLKPARDHDTGIITRIAAYLPEFRTRRFA